MNILIWILQGLMAFIFMYSGINKFHFDEKTLVEKGQTGIEGLSKWFIKFIGISEIFGSVGLIVPELLDWMNCLTPLASVSLGFIMIPATIIHLRRNEKRNVLVNLIILLICGTIAYYRM